MMFNRLVIFAILAVCLFAMTMAIVGCGGDDPPVEEDPIKFVSANPADGSTIQNDATITVTFDGIPEGLQVTGGSAVPGGKTVTIAGPFAAGPLVLGLQWEGDAVVLSYTVAAAIIDVHPPEGSTIGEIEEIWIDFDSPPDHVSVRANTGDVGVPVGVQWLDGDSALINGVFSLRGPLELKIEWDGVEHTLHYNVLPEISPRPPPPAVISVNPPDGSVIPANGTITVVFDNHPDFVTANWGLVTLDGQIVTISGPFIRGPLALIITWDDDGGHALSYTVVAPDFTEPTVRR